MVLVLALVLDPVLLVLLVVRLVRLVRLVLLVVVLVLVVLVVVRLQTAPTVIMGLRVQS
jgi:hypothetical protein